MTHDHDDELAALLALDALEPDEQADAELALEPLPAGLVETTSALALAVAGEAPADLRLATLQLAYARRAPEERSSGVVACSPDVAFERTLADFHALLLSLRPDEWDLPAHESHGSVHGLVSHLVGVERLNLRWLDPNDDVPQLPDHIAATRATVEELRAVGNDDLVRLWHDAAMALLAAARANPDRNFVFHDVPMAVPGLMTTRTFELWAHGMDIALAAGRPLPMLDDERMALMSTRLMGAIPGALAYRRASVPGRSVRLVLTGPAGGCYLVPLKLGEVPTDNPDATIIVDTVAVCRLAARRLERAELGEVIEGDEGLAERVLAHVGAFARD